MITYLTIGFIYSFIMHLLWDYNKRNDKDFEIKKWTLWESLVLALTWPIYLGYFIWSFIDSFFNNSNE